jgi:hypothetical protein
VDEGSQVMKAQFHHLYRTQCLIDGAAYFGIASNDNPFYGQDGNFPFAGAGRKLLEHFSKHGANNFRVNLIESSENYEKIKAHLDKILKDVDGHPLSLNVSTAELGEKMREINTGVPKSEDHKEHIALAMIDNKNALGHVVTEDTKKQIRETKKKRLKWIHNPDTNEELQIEADETLLRGFKYGRLSDERRKEGPKRARIDVANMTDDERVRMPDFMIAALQKQSKG